MKFSNVDLVLTLLSSIAKRSGPLPPARHSRSAEEVAWLRQRAAAKRARRMDRNRWNAEMERCGRPQLHWLPLGIRWAITHGYLKPKRRHGHATH